MKNALLITVSFAFAGVLQAGQVLQVDFSTGAGTQAGWEAIGGTGSPSGSFSGYTDLAGAGDITVSLANISYDRLYKNGFTGPADDFPGTDLDAMYSDLLFRNNDAATVDVTISGLLAGTYQITTHHLNAPNTPSEFDLIVTDADNPSGKNLGNSAMGLGNTSSFNPTVITFEVVSNGTDDIILQLDATFIGTGGNTGGWFGFNGMEIATVPESSPLVITDITLDANDMISLTWNSIPGKVYTIHYSLDLLSSAGNVGDNYASQGESTTHTFQNPTALPGPVNPRLFLWVEENP